MTPSGLLRHLLSIGLVLAGLVGASAQSADSDTQNDFKPQKREAIACEGPFASDTSHAKLAAAFGAKNVVFKEVDGAEGSKEKASVIFGEDLTRRIVVYWQDELKRAKPSFISVHAPSLWIGPGGVGNGMQIAEVEKLNGKAFKVAGFGWDGGGFIRDLDGKLKDLPGGCSLIVRFEPGIANPLPARYAEITGDKTILSNNRLLRRAKPQVSEWGIGYPQ